MILTGDEILKQIKKGNIEISPFDISRLNPNSYNLRLHNKMLVVEEGVLDMKEATKTREVLIPETGYMLEPGRLYLGRTEEFTKTLNHVPLLEGRSSIGRLGIFIHATAGFGDLGFTGYWTLEISVVQPVVIYPFTEICQIYYNEVKGKIERYEGKYQNNAEIQVSGLYKELG
jgi:dCTP deaminase